MTADMENFLTDSSYTIPADYPEHPVLDSFTIIPDNTSHEERKAAYIDWCLKNPSEAGTKTPFLEIARLSRGVMPNQKILYNALQIIAQRPDCADFGMQVILWLLFKFANSPLLNPQLIDYAKKVVLDFKYWPEEPGQDDMCTWTENHQILFSTAAYLFGQMFTEEIFTNSGQTGQEKMDRNRPRIMRWLELRFQTGFSEWFSNVYYAEDLPALLSLIEFSQDLALVNRAKMVLDLMLLDIAANSFHGIFASSHGRSYVKHKTTATAESTSPISKMCFGMGHYHDSLCAVPFALSQNYSLPPVIESIGNHIDETELLNQQRCGLLLAEAKELGLAFDNFEDAMRFLSLEAYLHPKTAATNLKMFDAYDWWENSFLRPLKSFRGLLNGMRKSGLLPFFLRAFEWDVCRNTREAVDVLTYRTPNYMLSSAQEYRVGYGGDQQSIWQAIIGQDATVFTTHPGETNNGTPDEWTGSGILPHVRQEKNVLLCIYNLHHKPALYQKTAHTYTHAWFPRDKFDEVIEQNGWVFARKEKTFLGLHSSQPTEWIDNKELRAQGRKIAWILELGSLAEYNSFQDFINQISRAEIHFKNLTAFYHSPTLGRLSLRYKGLFTMNGQVLQKDRYPRYGNTYVQANYPAQEVTILKDDRELSMNFEGNLRRMS